MSVDTWVRLHSGKIITAVSLYETYGQDDYPINADDDANE